MRSNGSSLNVFQSVVLFCVCVCKCVMVEECVTTTALNKKQHQVWSAVIDEEDEENDRFFLTSFQPEPPPPPLHLSTITVTTPQLFFSLSPSKKRRTGKQVVTDIVLYCY